MGGERTSEPSSQLRDCRVQMVKAIFLRDPFCRRVQEYNCPFFQEELGNLAARIFTHVFPEETSDFSMLAKVL